MIVLSTRIPVGFVVPDRVDGHPNGSHREHGTAGSPRLAKRAEALWGWDRAARWIIWRRFICRTTKWGNNFDTVLEKIGLGIEVVVEYNHRPVALIRSPLARGRLLSECIALAEARVTTAVPDEGFMQDVAEGIAERSKPGIPPAWE